MHAMRAGKSTSRGVAGRQRGLTAEGGGDNWFYELGARFSTILMRSKEKKLETK
jgi:hypothetical protein